MADNDTDVLIVGAGVVGLAVARAFALRGYGVVIAERQSSIGMETSSRNSEVIHAGIYYEPKSLKARLCVEGKRLLYDYCAKTGVGHKRLGKLIIAQSASEVERLSHLQRNAQACGVGDVVLLSGSEALALEPDIKCQAALLSPSTGIVDSHGLMLALLANAEEHGASLALRTSLVSATPTPTGFTVQMQDASGEVFAMTTQRLVNCAGHGAHQVARNIEGLDGAILPPRFMAKGSYCNVSGPVSFKHLIYPVPVPGALGIHITLDLSGAARLGPNIEWVAEEDYAVTDEMPAMFRSACQSYWPDVAKRVLTPAYSGIRPKISGPGMPNGDFVIQGPETLGIEGLVNLFGIESPGLTASLAISEHVAGLF